jgi:hypothetical protein
MPDDIEVWKPIIGHESYSISNHARIESRKRPVTKLLAVRIDTAGYQMATLSENNKLKNYSVHRLVALHHVDNPNPEVNTDVDHIDGNKRNNVASNLRWVPKTDNMMNRALHSNNTSGYRGVYFRKNRNIFEVFVCVDQKRTFVGSYYTLETAISGRDAFMIRNSVSPYREVKNQAVSISYPDEEIWKQIAEFPEYFISSHGRVKSLKFGKETILNPQTGALYRQVHLINSSGGVDIKIHRLVAINFIPNPEGKPIVDHTDHNPSNNHISNLRWATESENRMNRSIQNESVPPQA